MKHPLLRIPKEFLYPDPLSVSNQPPVCPICHSPVPLETAKTDEQGAAIHEQCYLLKVKLSEQTTLDNAPDKQTRSA
jgi:hypothetical protein